MSRTDNYIGLSPRAEEFLKNNCHEIFVTTIREYPKDREKNTILSEKSVSVELWSEKYDKLEGAFYNSFPLYEYYLRNGKTVIEVLQADPWSSGPCFFLCLADKDTGNPIEETKWTEEEIEEYI